MMRVSALLGCRPVDRGGARRGGECLAVAGEALLLQAPGRIVSLRNAPAQTANFPARSSSSGRTVGAMLGDIHPSGDSYADDAGGTRYPFKLTSSFDTNTKGPGH